MSLSLTTSLKEECRSPSLSTHTRPGDVKVKGVAVKVTEEMVVPPVDSGETLRESLPSKLEASASPKDSESPASSTPPVSGKRKTKSAPEGPQLIADLPRAESDAFATFTEIEVNHYQYGTLGRSREALESMLCDCQYEHGVDSPYSACGDGSDCINRLTQVECLPDDCRCRAHCQNQRFQLKQYAPIHIVLTEKKGFGLRAAADLPKDTFIYEYVGDVVAQPSMKKRMRDYAKEGIKHFYFMMLQKDEFIDATKRGGIGRFANHSCNPNCYVAKWAIGQHVRMGIFANRTIQKDEELTFNYNVDRYGHEAQQCFCGEAKCVGYIGGKTQTDLAAMDDLYLDALGISDEVEKLGLKGNKRKKSRKLDEDFTPILKPLVEKDVPKVIQAIRQTSSRKVLIKLLTRIKITEDMSALRQIMRLRGFSLMTNILQDHATDLEIPLLAMQCMSTWPLLQRNKVEDSRVNVYVERFAESENSEPLRDLARKLLDKWAALEYAYRIPKRLKADGEEEILEPIREEDSEDRASKRSKVEEDQPKLNIKPLGIAASRTPLPTIFPALNKMAVSSVTPITHKQPSRQEIAAVIAAAARPTAEAPIPSRPDEKKSGEKKTSSRRDKGERKKQSKEEKETNKEKKLKKLVGAVVVKTMSKYQKYMDHDTFKKYAKELTELVVEKEKKSSSYKEDKLDGFSEEKTSKIKKFAKEYIAKVIRKLKDKKKKHAHSAGSSTSQAVNDADVAAEAEGEGEEIGAEALESMVAETMDFDMADEDDDGMDMDEDEDMDHDEVDGEDHDRQAEEERESREDDSPEETEMVVTPIHTSERGDLEVKDPRLRSRTHSDDTPWELSECAEPVMIARSAAASDRVLDSKFD